MSKLEELQAQQAAIEKAILEEKTKGKKDHDVPPDLSST